MIVRELLTKWGFKVDDKALKSFEERLGGIQKTVKAVGAAATVAAAGMFGLARSTAKAGDWIAKTARGAGLTAEALQELMHAANIGGVSNDEFAKTVQKLSRTMKDARDGLTSYQEAFDELGVSVVDSEGNLRATDAVLEDMAEAFQRMPDGPTKTALAMELLGRGGAKMIPFLNAGKKSMRALRVEAHELGGVLDKETLDSSEAWIDAMARMKMSLNGIKNIVAMALMPTIINFMDGFRMRLVMVRKFLERFDERTRNVIRGLFIFVSILGPIALGFAVMLGLLAKLTIAWRLLGTTALIAYAKMLLIPALILAAAAAVALFIDDLVNFAKGNKSVIGEIIEKWKSWGKWTKLVTFSIMNALAPVHALLINIAGKWESIKGMGSRVAGFFKSNPMEGTGRFGHMVGPPAALAGAGAGGRSVDVKAEINITVPPGTPDSQAQFAADAAEAAARRVLTEENRAVVNAFPDKEVP